MNKVPDEMDQRKITLEDGRYMIFYTFAPLGGIDSPRDSAQVPEVRADELDKGN